MQAELQGAQASAEQATQAAQAAANDLREYRRDAQELSRQLHDVRRICAASQVQMLPRCIQDKVNIFSQQRHVKHSDSDIKATFYCKSRAYN